MNEHLAEAAGLVSINPATRVEGDALSDAAAESPFEQLAEALSSEVRGLRTLLETARRGEISLEYSRPYITKTAQDISSLIASFEEYRQELPSADLFNDWEQIEDCPLFGPTDVPVGSH